MHLLFGVSLVVQLVLAVHAYNHGRTSPWVWLILFFPLVGSLLYAYLFLLPQLRWSASGGGLSDRERRLRRVPRGPFAPAGDRPDEPIAVASAAEIEAQARREDCPECDHALKIEEHRADTIAGRRLRVVVLSCAQCGALPVRYFEIRSTHEPARLTAYKS